MGMYNEVFHNCPHCAKEHIYGCGISQIAQIGPGFGGYQLSDLKSLARQMEDRTITNEQLKLIAEESKDIWFTCTFCAKTFQADPAVILSVIMLADSWKKEKDEDTCRRAMELLRQAGL